MNLGPITSIVLVNTRIVLGFNTKYSTAFFTCTSVVLKRSTRTVLFLNKLFEKKSTILIEYHIRNCLVA